jgi:hypothetical protein
MYFIENGSDRTEMLRARRQSLGRLQRRGGAQGLDAGGARAPRPGPGPLLPLPNPQPPADSMRL